MTNLERKVMDQIEKRGLTPRPYAYFLAKRSVFWSLAVVSIILGAVSVALTLYSVRYSIATGGATLDEIPLDDLFDKLPFVWLAVLPLFVGSTYFAVTRTRRGYRLRTSIIVAGALAASLVLGGLLDLFDVGVRTHRFLDAHVPGYQRMVRSHVSFWTAPDKGRIGGRVLAVDEKGVVTLRDFGGQTWIVNSLGAEQHLSQPLMDEGVVGVLGVRTGPNTFKARSFEEWDEYPLRASRGKQTP